MLLNDVESFVLTSMLNTEISKKENDALIPVFKRMKEKLNQDKKAIKALRNFYQSTN